MISNIIAFDASKGEFTITISKGALPSDDFQCQTIYRTSDDFKQLRNIKDFPKTILKKLSSIEVSWQRNRCGWKPFYTKQITIVETWMNLNESAPSIKDFLNDDLTLERREYISLRRKSEKYKRSFQQYFSSKVNVETIVSLALKEASALENVIFVEPSCGDGRILAKLLSEGARHVIGYDLDPEVVKDATRNLQEFEDCKDVSINIFNEDYLTSDAQRIHLSETFAQYHLDCCIIVGNPPFSKVKCDVADIDTGDYPLLFLVKSASIDIAHCIILLLPQRCDSLRFHLDAKLAMDATNSFFEWRLDESLPADSCFDLGERIVRQHAVIQVWRKYPAAS